MKSRKRGRPLTVRAVFIRVRRAIAAVGDVVGHSAGVNSGRAARTSVRTCSNVRGRAERRNAFSFANAHSTGLEVCARGFDRGTHVRLFVYGEIVEHDDVARPERRDQNLLDICQTCTVPTLCPHESSARW